MWKKKVIKFWQEVKQLAKIVIGWYSEDDWHRDYVDSQLNHGQGPRGDENDTKV